MVARLSDKTSRLHPRHVVPKPAQAYEPEVPGKTGAVLGRAQEDARGGGEVTAGRSMFCILSRPGIASEAIALLR
jgi:hypothetical protein